MWVRTSLTSVLLLLAASVTSAASTTALGYTSSPLGYVGAGQTVFVSLSQGFTFTPTVYSDNTVDFAVNDFLTNPVFQNTRWWYLDFQAPFDVPLTVGHYAGATRWPFQAADAPGLSFVGNGRGPNQSSGFFDVLEIEFDSAGALVKFAADFTTYDENNPLSWNRGSLRFNSSIPVGVPEPGCLFLLPLVGLAFRRS